MSGNLILKNPATMLSHEPPVIVEAMQYSKKLKEKTLEFPNGQKPNVTTLGVFSLLALGLSLITFPQIIQRVQEMRIVNNG